MANSAGNPQSPKPRRRRLRYSLGGFLVTCGLAGIVLGWIGRKIELAQRSPILLLAPITEGTTLTPVAAPNDAEILTVAEPFLPPGFRTVSIYRRRVKEHADTQRSYPLVGNACQIHRIYQCFIVGECNGRPQMEVIYIDHNNLHVWR